MPSKNEIVPLDATLEQDALRGPEVPGVVNGPPVPKQDTRSRNKVNASNTAILSAQEQRMVLVRAQRRYTAFQVLYGFFGLLLMMAQVEYMWYLNTQTLPETCPVHATTHCPLCFQSLGLSVPVHHGRMILLALRALMTLTTIFMLYYIYRYYEAECEIMKLKNILPPKTTVLGSSLRRTLFLEIAILSLHPFPGIGDIDPKWPQLTIALSLFMLTRVVLVVRVVQHRNSFNSRNGWFIGALTNVDFSATFFLKTTLKSHPIRCLTASFAAVGCVAGYSLYVAERFLCAFKGDSCCQPMLLGDAIWMLVITIFTIGYGDVVPRTTLGRAIAVSAGIYGTLFIAVIIAAMSNHLVLTRSEHKVSAFLKKDENRKLINDHAARVLQAFVQLRTAQRRHYQSLVPSSDRGARSSGSSKVLATDMSADNKVAAKTGNSSTNRMFRSAERKLFTVLARYRHVKRRVQSQDVNDPMDIQMTMLELMEVNVEYIRAKLEELSELFVAQTGKRSRSLRRISTTATSVAVAHVPTRIALVDEKKELSLPHANGSAATIQQIQPHANQSQAHPLPQKVLDSREQSSTTINSQANTSNVRNVVINEVDGKLDASTAKETSQISEGIPAWALRLELTFQGLLEQVTRVSDEVEAMKARAEAQAENLETRVMDLEQRLDVTDALREISRMRGSYSRPNDEGSTSGSVSSFVRHRRLSVKALQRPSIQNDVLITSEVHEFEK